MRRVRDTAAGAVRRSPLRPPARFVKKCLQMHNVLDSSGMTPHAD